MAGITGVVFYQWTSYWRQIRRPGNLTAAHHGIWLVLVGLILFKYVQMLRAAALELTTANTMKLEGLLAGIFLAWMFPLVGNAEFGVPRDWLHLPLSFTETL